MSTAIKVENLSKIYRLGEIGTGTISHDLERWWAGVRGKEDPFLKIGQPNDRSTKSDNNLVFSLRDLNFEIQQGDAVGIIGKNGAGKSTLLKILSRVTSPTTGKINIKGRVASLLEVGTGFHPELTGRENIYLNGAILGMRKWEIDQKLEEIIDFSGVERYVDTPVKRYSSGMYVRLAFAVAAHLESEILVVDEVLAVGDAEFQKKCLGKMGDISNNEGRTVLFVSHNLSSVLQLCKYGVVLEHGRLNYMGTANYAVDTYVNLNRKNDLHAFFEKKQLEYKKFELIQAELLDDKNYNKSEFEINEVIKVSIWVNSKELIPGLYGYVVVKNKNEEIIIESDSKELGTNYLQQLTLGKNNFILEIPQNILSIGEYSVYFSFTSPQAMVFEIDVPGDILRFNVVDNITSRGHKRRAKTGTILKWHYNHVE
jgi:lipopolysaccharide transport system ATP-binding protein